MSFSTFVGSLEMFVISTFPVAEFRLIINEASSDVPADKVAESTCLPHFFQRANKLLRR